MGDFNAKYDLIKIYNNLKHSESNSKIENQPKAIYKKDLISDNLA